MKPSNVILPLLLSWHHNGVQLDSSILGITISEEEVDNTVKSSVLHVTFARVLNSGSYTCSASVSIPESRVITTNAITTVEITGML